MKTSLSYCAVALAMGLVFPGQANATCDVDFDGEKLEIKCDNGSDIVTVEDDGTHLLVDGMSEGLSEKLKDIVIETKGGEDKVTLSKLDVSGSIEVKTGKEGDKVLVADVEVENDLKIETGQGNDKVALDTVDVGNSIDVKMGGGKDTVAAHDTTLNEDVKAGNDIKLDGGSGNDSIFHEDEFDAGNIVEIKDF